MQAQDSMSRRISSLRKSLALNQSELGAKLGCSAMAVSRWERGALRCPASILIRLGVLSESDDCWFFWGLAGLTTQDVMRVLPVARKRFVALVPALKVIATRTQTKDLRHAGLVGIPLLPLRATAANQGRQLWDCDFDLAAFERLLAVPVEWCPNPDATICLRIKGNAMQPLLHDGYIAAVDRKQNDLSKLHKKIVIAHHEELGLIVARVCLVGKQHLLVPDNREYEAVHFSQGWRIIGTVLWWTGYPSK